MTEFLIGHIVGKYRIEEKLGEGGMGVVYKATDLTLDRPVALKILLAEITEDQKLRDRLRQEARALARFNHPNIAILYEFDEVNNFLAMEFIEGETVDAIIAREGLLTPQRIREVMRQVLPALGMAHKAGIIHRDIKPSNIMLTRQETVKIMDFGIAKVSGSGAQTVSTGRIVGSYLYISPEQIEHKPVDARTDVYSLGVTLYEMATGHVPFETENHFLLMKAHIEEPPAPPSYKNPGVPPMLEKVIMKALEKKPEDRYQSADEMLLALESIPTKKEKLKRVKPKKEGGPEEPSRFGLKPVLLGVGIITLILLVAGLWGSRFFSHDSLNGEQKPDTLAPPGALVLENFPAGGVLKVDGKEAEYKPEGLNLPEGQYAVSIDVDGRTVWQKLAQVSSGIKQKIPVEISAGDLQAVPVSEKGSFSITADPATAQAFLDEAPVRSEEPVSVVAGRHTLRLSAPDYRDTVIEFVVGAGDNKNFGTVRLPGLAQWIILKNVPAGARVLLNGVPVDFSGQKLEVVSGTHTVAIQTPKRAEFSQEVKIATGKPATVTYVVPKGSLSLKAIPYATFFIDGKPAGKSGPSLDTLLESGTYSIRFTHPGFGKGPLQFDTAVFIGDAGTVRLQQNFARKK